MSRYALGSGASASNQRIGVNIGSIRLAGFSSAPTNHETFARLREWTRERFKLAEDAAIFVTQVACPHPGCPPLETFVAFWTETQTRHHFKIFKPIEEVVFDDLPPAWLKDALCAIDGTRFGCC
jgi:hypothetical protein